MPDDNTLDMAGLGETSTEATETAETTTAQTAEPLVPVETLGAALPAWKLAGVMRHNRWAPGKAVTQTEFDAAAAAFAGRPLGGGR